jgi:hypothetical protein
MRLIWLYNTFLNHSSHRTSYTVLHKGSPQSSDSVVGEIGEGHGGQLSGTAAAKDTAGCYSIGNQSIE